MAVNSSQIQNPDNFDLNTECDSARQSFPDSCIELHQCRNTRTWSMTIQPHKDLDLYVDVNGSLGSADCITHLVREIEVRSSCLSKSLRTSLKQKLHEGTCERASGSVSLLMEEAVAFVDSLCADADNCHRKCMKKKKRLLKRHLKESSTNSGENTDNEDHVCVNSSSEEYQSRMFGCEPSEDRIKTASTAVSTAASTATSTTSIKPRPNYFVAIRITNEHVIRGISSAQDMLVQEESLLSKGVIPGSALHLTLCNLGLDSADDLTNALEALQRMKKDLLAVVPQSPLVIQGMSQFYNRAIYAQVQQTSKFLKFRETLVKNFRDRGVEMRDDHDPFTPHVTVIKVKRPERKLFGSRNIRPSLYSAFVNTVFGEQKIEAVYLCAMNGQKREDGFYVTVGEIHFDDY